LQLLNLRLFHYVLHRKLSSLVHVFVFRWSQRIPRPWELDHLGALLGCQAQFGCQRGLTHMKIWPEAKLKLGQLLQTYFCPPSFLQRVETPRIHRVQVYYL
jgi:hypothetical protein